MTKTFDYIVVGGGSSGCVVAGRLTENVDISVCLLEAGSDGRSSLINIPAAMVTMVPTSVNNWAFDTVPQTGLNGRKGYQPRGKTLGGSSAINAMIYVRGHQWDYDHWASLGNDGWAFKDVLPYFRRNEHNERIDNDLHGRDGPLWVSDSRSDNPFQQRFMDAARERGLPLNNDFNGAEQEGVGIYQVTQKHGERCSAARAYLLPHVNVRPNLTVETHAKVQRIVFEGTAAVGVEVLQNGRIHLIRASKEVILAAGAFQTPQLLMVSGVGPKDELLKHGIPILKDLPGVGKNLQDHPDFVFVYKSSSLDATGFSLASVPKWIREISRFRRERRGMLTSNFAEGGAFLRTNMALDKPDIQLHFVVAPVEDHARKLRFGHGLSCHVCLLRPRSRGTVLLSSKDPQAAPLIDPAFFQASQDLEDMVAAFKLTRSLMEAPALKRWISHDAYASGIDSDDQIRSLLRHRTDSVYHPVGTCRMGKDGFAVVDSQLRVHGLQRLRIVDASVMPTLIGGNTNAPTIMIAEKAVDMIRGINVGDSSSSCETLMPIKNSSEGSYVVV